MILAVIIWALTGIAFLVLGIWVTFSKKEAAFGFWANAETFPVKDVKAYNRALGRLYIAFGIVFLLLGIPLLFGQNSWYIIVSILGLMVEAIAAMALYTTVIEPKYRRKS